MSTTLSTLIDRLSQRVGDYLQATVTTALTTSKSVVSTDLNKYTNRDDFYNRYWVYITDKANIGDYRRVDDYTNSTGTLTVIGANFLSDTANLATFQLHKYDRNNKIRALNRASRAIFPNLFKNIINHDLRGQNILPNAHFEDWSSTTALYFASASNVTLAESSSTYRGSLGTSSAKATASAGNGYVYFTSATYPKLLDLSGQTVNLTAWAYPEVANDASLVIYTLKADGTAQTLTSTTTCPATAWTKLELLQQTLNDDLVLVEIRFKTTTNSKYVQWDDAQLFGADTVYEYCLPLDFQNAQAKIKKVCVDGEYIFDWDVNYDSTYGWLKVGHALNSGDEITIEGIVPLESTLAAVTDTISLSDPYVDLLVELAASYLMDAEAGSPSSLDRNNLISESIRYMATYNTLKRNLRMKEPQGTTRFKETI